MSALNSRQIRNTGFFPAFYTKNADGSHTPNNLTLPASETAAATTLFDDITDLADLEGDGLVIVDGFRSADFVFYGTDAADETFSCSIWAIYKITQRGAGKSPIKPTFLRKDLGVASITLGAYTGVGTGLTVDTDQFIADTTAFTNDAYMTHLEGALDVAVKVHSPGSDGVAVLSIPDVGNCYALWLDLFQSGVGPAATGNALVNLGI